MKSKGLPLIVTHLYFFLFFHALRRIFRRAATHARIQFQNHIVTGMPMSGKIYAMQPVYNVDAVSGI